MTALDLAPIKARQRDITASWNADVAVVLAPEAELQERAGWTDTAIRTDIPALVAEVERLRAALGKHREFVDFVRSAPVASGVCCCGDNMETHSSPMICGHSPVDMWDNSLMHWIEVLQKPEPAHDHT